MAGSVIGQIALELNVNTKEFKQQLQNLSKTAKESTGKISSMFGMVGKVAAVAFAAKTIVNFSKQCLQLGSDLAEVQNVVDVTFGNMSSSVNEWAKNAMTSFGLSEKVAKEYVGQFGAMSKAFGNSTQEAYNQATELAGLVGDVASFYNLTTDEAFTKLKAVYTGETESLKSLGVVMTQTALDEYALAKGFGKTTKSMSEQEKVALRLSFVTDRLSGASGDFVRTADGWANQTRILKLRFDALKATLGQGLINVLTPVIRLLNEFVAKLQEAAEMFKSFTELLFGDAGSSSLGATADSMAAASGVIAGNMGDTATSAAKIKKSLAGFDQINVLSSASGQSSGSGGTSSGATSPELTMPEEGEVKKNPAVGLLDKIKEKLEEISSWTGLDILWKSIKKGIKNIDFSAIKKNFEKTFKSLKPIAKSVFNSIGTIARSTTGFIGELLEQLITDAGQAIEITSGGVSQFLQSEGGTISAWIDDMSAKLATSFDNLSFSAETIFGSLWAAFDANQVEIENSIANMLTSANNAGMTMGTIATDMWTNLTENFAAWTAENKPLLDEFFNGCIETTTNFSNSISTIIGDMFTSISEWWTSSGQPVWDKFTKIIGDVVTIILNFWNTTLKPIIDNLINKVHELWTTTLKPLWENILGFFSDIGECIAALWNNWLKPIVNWIVEKLGPPIAKVVNAIVNVFVEFGKKIGGVINGIITVFRGIIQFLTGIFSKDWDKAWSGIKTAFTGVWTAIKNVLAAILNPLLGTLEKFVNGVVAVLNAIIRGINKISGKTGGSSISEIGKVSIPRLATGGYVEANTPQLAIIGDNKREGEIVAPESKITEAVVAAFRQFLPLFSNNGNNKPIYLTLKLGDGTFWEGFVDYHNDIVKRTGDTPLLI